MANPGLGATAAARAMPLDETEVLRAQMYALLGTLLLQPPGRELLARVGQLTGDTSPLGQTLGDLAAAARDTDATRLEREYHHLFIGVARGELVPFASYYRTGFLNERPLAVLRQDMAELGIAAAAHASDPEDHMGSLCEMMAGLIAGPFAVPLPQQVRFFTRHLAPWGDRFFADLEGAEAAAFYRPVGRLGRAFLAVEGEAFALAA